VLVLARKDSLFDGTHLYDEPAIREFSILRISTSRIVVVLSRHKHTEIFGDVQQCLLDADRRHFERLT